MNAVLPEPQPFRDPADLERMRRLLISGRQSGSTGFYVHTGDLNWWLYYAEPESSLWRHIQLWEGAAGLDDLDGWALLSPAWAAFDVFVRPELRGSHQAEAMYIYAEEQITEMIRRSGGRQIRTMWVGEGDEILAAHLVRRGFRPNGQFIQEYERPLEGLRAPTLPDGFSLRQVDTAEIARSRAAASQAAFGSDWDTERYLRRYLDFRRSPVYRPELDVVTLDPGGRVASFCLVWLDTVNRVGKFEPVGTHPDFQRRGLGRAVLVEGMRRMRAAGMEQAVVSTDGGDAPANSLYRSVGMQPALRLVTYVKQL